ncbi:hypothetical protein SMETW2_09880 [Serratia marcescens]|nr:hypothetical protein SMETW2_09880 [Serratia marcescens]
MASLFYFTKTNKSVEHLLNLLHWDSFQPHFFNFFA